MPDLDKNKHFLEADEVLGMNPQEGALYQRHLSNLHGKGGVDNPDGTRSTLYAIIGNPSDKEIETYNLHKSMKNQQFLIPTVREGKIVSGDEAFDAALKEGIEKFPSYASKEEAEHRYAQMHDFMSLDTQDYQEAQSLANEPE